MVTRSVVDFDFKVLGHIYLHLGIISSRGHPYLEILCMPDNLLCMCEKVVLFGGVLKKTVQCLAINLILVHTFFTIHYVFKTYPNSYIIDVIHFV